MLIRYEKANWVVRVVPPFLFYSLDFPPSEGSKVWALTLKLFLSRAGGTASRVEVIADPARRSEANSKRGFRSRHDGSCLLI